MWLAYEEQDAWEFLDSDNNHWFWSVSHWRGGNDDLAGILWCDFREFHPVPGIHQIFGHTPSCVVRQKSTAGSDNYCLDTTDRCGWHHYAVVNGSSVSIRKSDGSPETYIDTVHSVRKRKIIV